MLQRFAHASGCMKMYPYSVNTLTHIIKNNLSLSAKHTQKISTPLHQVIFIHSRCNQNAEAKKHVIELYKAIVIHSYDSNKGGYIKALSRDWKALTNLRFGCKDANEKKFIMSGEDKAGIWKCCYYTGGLVLK